MTLRISKARDRGYFPRKTSVLHRVHRQLMVGWYYGQCALLMQGTSALAFKGLISNTKSLEAPYKRLVETAKMMEVVMYRPRSEADAVLEHVKQMHLRVKGTLSEDVGPHPAGTPYSANDPELSIWVLSCLAHSALTVYQTFCGRLSRKELTQYWDEYKILGGLFGIDVSLMPQSYADFQQYMHDRMHSGELYVTDLARQMGRDLALNPTIPLISLPGLPVLRFTVAGLLPDPIRKLYGIAWTTHEELAFRATALYVRKFVMPFVPAKLREGSCAKFYDLVARAEERRQG